MKKVIVGLSAALLLSSTALVASDDSKVYVVAKGLVTLGDSYDHDGHELTGGTGAGFGIDLGYKINHSFSAELVTSYATNTVEDHLHVEADGSYMTYGAAIAYVYHLSDKAGLLVKAGYEMEKEKISDFHVDATHGGFIYAVGAEYKIAPKYEALVEYEGSTIHGPKGAAVFAGVKYNF